MPAARNYVTRTVTTYTYTIRFRDGSEITESFDHRLDLPEIMHLMSKHPDAFYNPTPSTVTATYRMTLADFVQIAERVPDGPPPAPEQLQLPADPDQNT